MEESPRQKALNGRKNLQNKPVAGKVTIMTCGDQLIKF